MSVAQTLASSTGNITVVPAGAALAAEIHGVDLCRIDDTDFAAIHRAWLDHQVLLFRGQHLDDDALIAFQRLALEEGILAALESSHAVAHACRIAPDLRRDEVLLINLSGRGDKDVISIQKALDAKQAETR